MFGVRSGSNHVRSETGMRSVETLGEISTVLVEDVNNSYSQVDETRSTLKLCDFGSSASISEQEIAPYLVARYYRAPEISEFH